MAVLVVDDNALNRRLVQVHLERLGQTVILAENGAAAITALETTPEIDLVVTDVMMPEMDGWSLVARMRERPEWGGLPVVVCSAYADLENVGRAREFGIQHFLVKPVSGEALARAVRAQLRQSPPRLAPTATVVSRLGLTREDYYQIVWDFAQELPQHQERAQALVDGGADAPPVSALVAGLTDLSESCTILGAERTLALIERLRDDPELAASGEEQRQLVRELTLLGTALGTRIEELDRARMVELEVQHRRQLAAEAAKKVKTEGVANTLSEQARGIRGIGDLPRVFSAVLTQMGAGAEQAIVTGESAKDLGLEFASWVPVILTKEGIWLDILIGLDAPSATTLLTAMTGEASADDDYLREVVKETMNMLQGALKSSFETDFVDAVVPKIPRPVRPSDFQWTPPEGDGCAHFGLHFEHLKVHLAVVEHPSPAQTKTLPQLTALDVVLADVASFDDADAKLFEKGTLVDQATAERMADLDMPGIEVLAIPVAGPSPFTQTLTTR